MTRFATIGLVIVLATRIAAADKPGGQKAFAEGRDLYAKGSYAAAAERFTAAFTLDPDPAYIFNVGQAYRRSVEDKTGVLDRDCFRSAAAYKKFLTLLPDAPNKKEIEGYVKDMSACAGSYSEPDKAIDKPIDKPVDKPVDKPADKPVDKVVKVEPAPSGGGGLRYAGLAVAGAGVIGVVVGAVFASKGSSLEQDRKNLLAMDPMMPMMMGPSGAEAARLDREGKSANLKAYVGFIGGGALVAAGTVMFLVGGKSNTERKGLTIAPTLNGAVARYRF